MLCQWRRTPLPPPCGRWSLLIFVLYLRSCFWRLPMLSLADTSRRMSYCWVHSCFSELSELIIPVDNSIISGRLAVRRLSYVFRRRIWNTWTVALPLYLHGCRLARLVQTAVWWAVACGGGSWVVYSYTSWVVGIWQLTCISLSRHVTMLQFPCQS